MDFWKLPRCMDPGWTQLSLISVGATVLSLLPTTEGNFELKRPPFQHPPGRQSLGLCGVALVTYGRPLTETSCGPRHSAARGGTPGTGELRRPLPLSARGPHLSRCVPLPPSVLGVG